MSIILNHNKMTSRSKIHRYWGLILYIVLLCSIPQMVYGLEVNGINYSVRNNTAFVTSLYDGRKYSGNLVVPREFVWNGEVYTVTGVDTWAFRDCPDLISVSLPNTITEIAPSAFSNCIGLNFLEFPNSVTSVGWGALDGCINMKSIILGTSVVEVGYRAFANCTNLVKIAAPACVKNQLGFDFHEPESPDLFEFDSQADYVVENGVIYDDKKSTLYFVGAHLQGNFDIPDSVVKIAEGAFYGCDNIKNIEMPDAILEIGPGAFFGCRSLTQIIIPKLVRQIDYGTFVGCEALHTVEFPSSLISIGNHAFAFCYALSALHLPESIQSIGGCAFYGCIGMKELYLPNSIEYIGWEAFRECWVLDDIYYNCENPIAGDKLIFEGRYDTATLFVPEYCIKKCEETEPWKSFSHIRSFPENGLVKVSMSDNEFDDKIRIFTLNGVEVYQSRDHLTSGVYILRKGDISKKISVR